MNADECLMTRMQEMSLDYHFTVEQEVGSSTYAFFGFNGNMMPNVSNFISVHFSSKEQKDNRDFCEIVEARSSFHVAGRFSKSFSTL